MVVSKPGTQVKPSAVHRSLFAIGLLAVAIGMTLLVMSGRDRSLLPAGAAALLLGVVLVGSYLINRLQAEAFVDPLAFEPPWSKLARGAGPPRLPAPGKLAAAPSTAFAIDKLIDFPAAPTASRPAQPARSVPPPPVAQASWTPALFDQVSAQQFDAVCEALFAQGGFEIRGQSHGTAGGVTLWLYSRNAQQGTDSPAAVAWCKQWSGQPVGVRELHPLLDLMRSRQLKRGTCATSSICSENARKFAKDNGINLLDRAGLLALIAGRTPAQQQALLALARGKR
ncbi:MAG: restriction endonuclease [Polaromonas sp.]|uniref:restriction endonuclease n=1 Tax=Polaromonas sp. TaxID=1869339 RepID=UPI0024899804|nr:restriction endonuclease [Polaromonas sp.]MDI1239106.1 restriction endonuclease [Polaromonas sp.]